VVLAGARPAVDAGALALTAAATWLAFAAHEVLHDPALRAARWSSLALALELLLLALAPFAAGAPLALAALAAPLAAWLWLRHRREVAPGAWCRLVFAAALPTVLSSTLLEGSA
jgi:hypothetical protein